MLAAAGPAGGQIWDGVSMFSFLSLVFREDHRLQCSHSSPSSVVTCVILPNKLF